MTRVTGRDLLGCAWTLALAYSANDRARPRRVAAVFHLVLYLVILALMPSVYHHDRLVVVSLHRQGDPAHARAAWLRTGALVCAFTLVLVLVVVLSGGSQLALGYAAVITVGSVVVPAVALLMERFQARRTVDGTYRREPGKPPAADWELSMLANRPGSGVQDGTGIALAHAKLLGAPSETIGLHARKDDLVSHYERHGVRSVPGGRRQMRGTLADVR